ncbi:MAG: protein of unknown function, contains DnaJ domain [Thermoleophilia bacterium]|nr:protein of unknown function, contains DnaJ domain [Thermoleophilia bacterium]
MPAPDRTHYEVLGLSRNADDSEVRRAWKMHVQVWHPDRFEGAMREEAEIQAKRINEAYTTLRDSGRRAAYDCRLAADESAARPEPKAAPRSRPSYVGAQHPPQPHVGLSQPGAAATHAPVPVNLTTQLQEIGSDLLTAARRHPRISLAAASVLVLVFGGSAILHAVTGPSLPAGATTTTRAAAISEPRVGADDAPKIDDLADEMREEAELAQRELAALLAQEAQEAPVEEEEPIAPRAGEALAPQLRKAPAAADPQVQEIVKPGGGRVLRVLPTTPS